MLSGRRSPANHPVAAVAGIWGSASAAAGACRANCRPPAGAILCAPDGADPNLTFMSIYLDNAATSFPKPESVYVAVDHTLRHCGANPGRGGHRMSLDAARLVFEAREAVAGFFGIRDASRLVFTSGATEAINLALFGLLHPGDHVVTTVMEHNAVLRPLRLLQDRGVTVTRVAADDQGRVAVADLLAACTPATRLVALTHCSNVTGTVQPVAEAALALRQRGIVLLVDAAQSAGLLPIDAEAMGIDLLAVPGHKGLLGPAGIGCLYVREGIDLAPLMVGGTGTQSESDLPPEQMPERLESGTLNLPGIAGLKAGIDWLQAQGLDKIRRHEQALLQQLVDGLRTIPGVTVYGPDSTGDHGGAVSFTCAGHDPAQFGFLLDHEFDIMVRVGLHCAPAAHRAIGSWPQGTIRVSPGCFSTPEQITTFLSAVAAIAGRP